MIACEADSHRWYWSYRSTGRCNCIHDYSTVVRVAPDFLIFVNQASFAGYIWLSIDSTSRKDRMNETTRQDDTFELYDLRVEVICPPGARILCGAKPGDHFTLQGEMLHLPPNQGFSIYSIGTHPLSPYIHGPC